MNPIQSNRTRLAILLSLIGIGLPWCQTVHAQGDVDRHVPPSMQAGSHESVVRDALGLNRPSVQRERTAAGQAANARRTEVASRVEASRNPAAIVWDANALGLGRRGPAKVEGRAVAVPEDRGLDVAAGQRTPGDHDRMRTILGLDREPMRAVGLATLKDALRRPAQTEATAVRIAERPTVATAAASPVVDAEVPTLAEANDTAPAAADGAAPTASAAPTAATESSAGGDPSLAAGGPIDGPKHPERDPAPAITEAVQIVRRATPGTPVTLSLPPEDVESLDETLRIRLRGQFRLLERDEAGSSSIATASDASAGDPMLALLQVLSNREEYQGRPAPIIFVAGAPEDPRAAVISAGVFRHVADSIARWFAPSSVALAPAPEPSSAPGGPAIASASEAPEIASAVLTSVIASPERTVHAQIALLDPVRARDVGQAGARALMLPMNHFDWQGDDAIDVSALLVDHPSLVTSTVATDTRSGPLHPLMALRERPVAKLQVNRTMNDLVDIFDPHLALAASKHMLIALQEPPAATPLPRRAIADLVDIFDPDLALARVDREPPVTDDAVASSGAVRSMVAPHIASLHAVDSQPKKIAAAIGRPAAVPPAATPASIDARSSPSATQIVPPEQALVREIELQRTAPAAPAVVFEADQDRMNALQGSRGALADARLGEMRGGFETDGGLRISFGIERAVYINGNLVTSTSLNVADLSKLTAGQVQSVGPDRTMLGIIQSGSNNAFSAGQLGSSSVGTVIQNTLNDQRIQGITQINATVNSLDLIRRTNIQQTIQSALADSIRH